MYYEEYGSRENMTIMMLHGAFFVDIFESQYNLSERYHIIVPHIMGFGKEADKDFDLDTFIEDLVDLCKEFDDLVIIGFSIGAQIAFKVVSEYPDLFKGAIMISPWLINKENISDKIINGSLKMHKKLQNEEEANTIDFISMMEKGQRAETLHDMQNVTEETVNNMVDNHISLKSVDGFEDLTIPTMVIVGGKEGEVMLTSAENLCNLNDNCKKYTIKRAGHNIPYIYTKELETLIVEFLERL